MPIDVNWYVPDRVIMMRSHGDLTIEEAKAANKKILEFLDLGKPLIHTLVDQLDMGNFPISLRDNKDALSAIKHPNVGWTVVYGNPNKIADFISGMIARMGRLRYRKFTSKEEAIAFLADQDPSVADALLAQK